MKEDVEKQVKKDMEKLVKKFAKDKEAADEDNKKKLDTVKANQAAKLKGMKDQGLLLPQFRTTTHKASATSVANVIKNIEPHTLVEAIAKQSKEELKKGLPLEDTYIERVWAEDTLQQKRKEFIIRAIKVISDTWDGDMMADIKVITLISDVHLDHIRNTMSKDYHEEIGNTLRRAFDEDS